FFPSENTVVSLLNTFAVFAVGYFARPLGGILFGHYGDKFCRKKGVLLAIIMMACTTVLIGLIPSYAVIGILAPILLVTLRFLQGMALG
ncbi:MFS transporter, partial [Salmonella sp. SAL4450]|uniref:MFS transporter n=1 Tax=Salmonella sp. SAL4450 TaxID=3159905 RepID=UPI0039799CF5